MFVLYSILSFYCIACIACIISLFVCFILSWEFEFAGLPETVRRDSLRWSVPWFITRTESRLHSPKTTGYAQLKLAIENLWLSVSPVNFGFLPTPAVVTFVLVSPWLAHAPLSCPFGQAGRDPKCCSRTHVFLFGQMCSRLKLFREMGSGVYLHQSSRHWTDYQPGMVVCRFFFCSILTVHRGLKPRCLQTTLITPSFFTQQRWSGSKSPENKTPEQ